MKQDNSPNSDLPAGIGKPARRALEAAGFNSLRQLELVREGDLLRLHGVGPKAIRVLRQALSERGASFLDSAETRIAE